VEMENLLFVDLECDGNTYLDFLGFETGRKKFAFVDS